MKTKTKSVSTQNLVKSNRVKILAKNSFSIFVVTKMTLFRCFHRIHLGREPLYCPFEKKIPSKKGFYNRAIFLLGYNTSLSIQKTL